MSANCPNTPSITWPVSLRKWFVLGIWHPLAGFQLWIWYCHLHWYHLFSCCCCLCFGSGFLCFSLALDLSVSSLDLSWSPFSPTVSYCMWFLELILFFDEQASLQKKQVIPPKLLIISITKYGCGLKLMFFPALKSHCGTCYTIW